MGNDQLKDAIDLAEDIVREVTAANQNWTAVERMAATLAELASQLAEPGVR
jgi:hypothetical protein